MTVQQLFQEINAQEFLLYYMTHNECVAELPYRESVDFDKIDKFKLLIKNTFKDFQTRKVRDNPDDIFFVIPSAMLDEKNYVFSCNREEILTKEFPEHYSVEESKWDTVLGGTLSHYTYFKYFNKVEIAYELFNALTYMGFEEEDRNKNIENLFEDIKESIEDITYKISDFNDTLKELGIELSDIESDSFEDECYQLELIYRKDMFNLFMKYEKIWLQENELLENNS